MAEYDCNIFGCYETSRWHDWGRWIFAGLVILFFLLFIAMFIFYSARRRHRSGLKPIAGTGWLVPKNRYPTHNNYYGGAEPGPLGPAGYYPPPPPAQDGYGNYTNAPPPYIPSPQFTGTSNASVPTNGYFAPPQGPPPPAHTAPQSYEMSQQLHTRGGSEAPPYSSESPIPPPAVPISSHPTGTSTTSYVQSNNPFQPPVSPLPPIHKADHGAAGNK